MKKCYLFLLLFFYFSVISILGQAPKADTTDIYSMSLEQLMNMQITSVSKKAEKFQNVPSSLYVITANDIEKSGATNLMELLRESVPGYWAASLDYRRVNDYIRNSNSGSVLVLLDGTPMLDLLTSSFDYSNFDIPLSEIERVEVIKGSGGTVYGANSASGVISIFTKSVKENTMNVNLQAASPTYANVNFSFGSKCSRTFTLRAYGQYNYFGGYKQLDAIKNSTSVVTNSLTNMDTTITSRYTGNDQTTQYLSFGLSPEWQVSEKLTLSGNFHVNTAIVNRYVQDFPINESYVYLNNQGNVLPFAKDTAFLTSDNKTRVVGNIKAEIKFSDKHNLFFRTSTNWENEHQPLGGGYESKNSIVDFEIQDNLELPYNTFSLGANYRFVNYNLYNFYDIATINYLDPKATKNLKGAFIQDKISLFDNKLNFYLGVKTENFSLINNNFYFSPMGKVTFNPVSSLTLWGGYTKAYTTPGYNQTNVEFAIFHMNSTQFFSYTVPLTVYQQTYNSLIGMGLSPANASTQATAFLQSPAGQDTVSKYIQAGVQQYPNTYKIAVVNGPKTDPTSMSSIEFGIRFQPFDILYLESNFYSTSIKNGIINSPTITSHVASRITPGQYVDAYFYGNYVEGTNTGVESLIKILPNKGFEIELSHSWYSTNLQYQQNPDFNISQLSSSQLNLNNNKYPTVPANVFRAKISYDLPWDLRIMVSGLYSSAFANTTGTVSNYYEYDLQRFDPLYGDQARTYKSVIGNNNSRTIINVKIDKSILNKKLDLFVFGNDITSSPFVESVNQLTTVYPRQIGGMYGLGVSYNFK